MIHSNNLSKNFTSYKKESGVKGSLKSFFNRKMITKSAVDKFCLDIKKGEMVGLLGPNGAGKTTLMKMFTGIIVPSEGDLEVAGYKPWQRDKEFRKKIAIVMGQKSQLWWDIPAMDSFRLLMSYYEISKNEFKRKIEFMSELLKVKDLLHIQVRRLSLGERMKLELMASLLHSPEVIFLDEPTIGLDLVAQESIREFVKLYHRENNATFVLTSHYMADVQALCERLVLITGGKKTFDGPLEKFETILGDKKSLSFTFDQPMDTRDPNFANLEAEWTEENRKVEVRIDQCDLREYSRKILADYPVSNIYTEKMPIEKVMKTLMANPALLDNQP